MGKDKLKKPTKISFILRICLGAPKIDDNSGMLGWPSNVNMEFITAILLQWVSASMCLDTESNLLTDLMPRRTHRPVVLRTPLG